MGWSAEARRSTISMSVMEAPGCSSLVLGSFSFLQKCWGDPPPQSVPLTGPRIPRAVKHKEPRRLVELVRRQDSKETARALCTWTKAENRMSAKTGVFSPPKRKQQSMTDDASMKHNKMFPRMPWESARSTQNDPQPPLAPVLSPHLLILKSSALMAPYSFSKEATILAVSPCLELHRGHTPETGSLHR